MLTIPHCLDNRLKDGGKVVGLTRRQPLYSSETFSSAPGTHLHWRLIKPHNLKLNFHLKNTHTNISKPRTVVFNLGYANRRWWRLH
jgi:hypothetical protein